MDKFVNLNLKPGTYIVGVSGGVDSVVLLAVAARLAGVKVVVAHFDHGIRAESKLDADFVGTLAKSHNLPFELGHGDLGTEASEETARNFRYRFLQKCRKKHRAVAILLAHHQNDVIETIIINLIRGTGWRGLSSLRSHELVVRPLLNYKKQQLIDYAWDNNLTWREDGSNSNLSYLRNYVRHKLMPNMAVKDSNYEEKLLSLYTKQIILKEKIESEIQVLFTKECTVEGKSIRLSRYQIIMLDPGTAVELIQAVAYRLSQKRFTKAAAEALVIFCKAGKPGRIHKNQGLTIKLTKVQLIVESASDMVS